jgi:hypothetical protein
MKSCDTCVFRINVSECDGCSDKFRLRHWYGGDAVNDEAKRNKGRVKG